MTRVDFYVLPTSTLHERRVLACKLTEKAWRQGINVYIHTSSGTETDIMNNLLWTFRQGSFIPHEKSSAPLADREDMVVLIGQNTRYLYKFVKWEMEQAISMGMPIIAVNLNNLRQMDPDRCPPTIKNELAVHISFRAAIMQKALETWPNDHARLRMEGQTGPFYYTPNVYTQAGVL